MQHHRPRRALTGVDDLLSAGLAQGADRERLAEVAREFRIRLTPEMAGAVIAGAGMAGPGDDPVARQFVPTPAELTIRPEELADPIGDTTHAAAPGLTHRYPDRAILHATQTCEVYCRFCFRRETVGETGPLPAADLQAALDHIAATPAIREVILTGGDPLSLSPRRLSALVRALDAIPHVEVIRFHSRVPVVAPGRMSPAMLDALEVGTPVYVVVHTNHAQELTPAACEALRALTRRGIPLLSQSVLLRGINDDAAVLADLFRALLRNRVKPYYLHHCDLAKGTSHFRTTIAEGQAIMAALRGALSGIAIPAYVLDIPGGYGKVPLTGDWATPLGGGLWRITDWQGGQHEYRDPPRD